MSKPFDLRTLAPLPLLALAGIAASVIACAKPEEPKRSAWTCGSVDVPMGEKVRCTSQALTDEGIPFCDLHPEQCGTPESGGAGGTYECNAGEADCPPVGTEGGSGDPTGGAGGSDGTGTGGAGGTSSGGTDVGTTGGTSSSGGAGGAGDGTGTGDGTGGAGGTSSGGTDVGTTGGTSSSGGTGGASSSGSSGNGNGGGGSKGGGPVGTEGGSGYPGPDECEFVPDLPYCGGGSGGGSSTGSSGGAGDCTKNNCDAPGQTKGGASSSGGSTGTSSSGGSSGASSSGASSSGASSSGASSSGASSSGASSSGGSGGKGRHYKCTKDGNGNATCESTPQCVAGTHPAPCGACVPDGDDGKDCVPPSAGGCWVTGGGFVVAPNLVTGAPADGHDNFGGNAKPMKDGSVKGHWNHVDHGTGNHAKGRPEYIYCRRVDEPGPGQPGGKKGFTMNQVYFGGPAEWRENGAWASGYWFDVVAKDHGEPGSRPHVKNGGMPDTYHFTIRKMDDPQKQVSGAIVYETKGELEGGNIQMHPPNNGHPATQSTLPSWVGLEP